jgi:hypothetical protein
VDLNADGRHDVLSGSSPGQVYWFRRNADGSFAEGRVLQDKDGEEIFVGTSSTVFAVDWDADKDLDLLLGNGTGKIFLVENHSGGKELTFGEPAEIASLEALEVGGAHPVAADWNDDGKRDLVVGHSNGGVVWFANTADRGPPKLAEPVTLIPHSPAPNQPEGRRRDEDWGEWAKISVVDFNGDGRLDILLGDSCGSFTRAPHKTPQQIIAEKTAHERLPQMRSSWAAAMRRYRELLATQVDDRSSAERQEQLTALLDEVRRLKEEIAAAQETQEEFRPQRQSHGYVWLFERKPRAD